ncbi:MAG: hypothetical protein AAF502_19595 [Bacteroidota bacterium]
MLRTLILLLLINSVAARGQPGYVQDFQNLELEILKLKQTLTALGNSPIDNHQELRLIELERNFQNLTSKIIAIEDSLSRMHTEVVIPQKLKSLENEMSSALKIRMTSNFRSFVLAWYDLGEQLEAISATAESILIFPESQSKTKLLVNVGQYAGIGGSIAGAVLANKNPSQGVTTIGLSISVTGMLGMLFKSKKPRVYIENVSRNIAFTDNVHAFERIARTFSQKAGVLYHSVKENWDDEHWRPDNKDLREYYALIVLRKDLNVIVRHMKAKAEHLLKQQLTDEGRRHLNNLVFRYDKALQSWEISEIVYLNTYEFLAKTRQESFVR